MLRRCQRSGRAFAACPLLPPSPAPVSEESGSLIDLITKQTAAEGCPRYGTARHSSARLSLRPMRRRVSPRCCTVPGGGGCAGGCSSARGSAAGGGGPFPAPGSQRGGRHRRDGKARGGAAGSGMERSGPGWRGRGRGGRTLSACGRQLRPAGSGRGLTHTRLCVAGRSGPARSPGVGGAGGRIWGGRACSAGCGREGTAEQREGTAVQPPPSAATIRRAVPTPVPRAASVGEGGRLKRL